MKSIFTKLGKMLLCGVAFAVVGCTDYDTDIQKIAGDVAQAEVTIAELQDAIDALEAKQAQLEADYAKKADLEAAKASLEQKLNDKTAELKALVDALASSAATKEELAELQGKVNEAIEAANAEIAKLQAALDTKASKEDVETLKEGYQQTIEKFQNLELILEGKADQADVDLVAADVAALKQGYQETVAALTQIDADITALENQVGDNTSDIAALQTASAQAVLAITNLDGKVTGILSRVDVLEEHVTSLRQGYQETVAALTQIKSDIENLQDGVSDNADNIKKLQEAYMLLNNTVTNFEMAYRTQVEDIDARIDALEEVAETFKVEYPGIVNAVTNHKTAIETLNNEVDGLKSTISTLEKKYDEAISQIEEMLANKVDKAIFDATIANLTEKLANIASIAAQVPELLARVQSLVYVPDYSDHKATIQWAMVNNGIQALNLEETPAYTVLSKTSELKYLVKANTPADAESAAKAIEVAWEEVLDYLVEPVNIRTRSEEATADLEIVDVTAKDDVVTVSVVAKNFDYKFFDNPEEGIYSAAIVLKDDKGNNLTSEYTNLVPGKAEEYQMALFVYAEDPQTADETLRMAGNDETITYLIPCTDTETVKSAVKPIVGFVPVIDGVPTITTPVSFYTPELLAEEGYDVVVDMDITIVDTEKTAIHDGTMDTKPGPILIDKYFKIEGGNPVYDFHYSVKPDVAFEKVGKFSTVTYTFTCGNTVQNLTYRIELDNAQVEVNVGKYDEATGEYYTEVPWTVKLRDELTANGEEYAKNLEMAHIPYVGVDDIQPLLEKNNSLLSDWTKTVYVKTAGEWVADPQLTDAFVVTGWATEEYPKTISYAIKGGNYAWNNEYKVVYTSTNETEHIDLTTNVIIKLTYFPEEPFVLDFPVTFKMGANGSFQAAVDVLGEMYKKVTGDNEANYDYLGYGEKNADIWADYTADLVKDYQDGKYGSPVVNDNKLAAGYASNIWNLQLAQVAQNQYVDGVNTIEWAAEDIIDFDFDVTIHGEAYIPAYELIYSQDLTTVIDENTGRVHVYGEKTGDDQDATYTIDQADLAKYFNVNVNDVEGGLAEGHVLTVDFAVTDALDTEDVVIADLVQILPATTTDVEDNGATYLSLVRNNVVLHWNEYTGLEVPVRATLKLNGFEIGSRDITLWTEDPLTLKNQAQVIVKRAPGNENTVARIYENLLLTGILHGNQNLIEVPEDDNYETLFEDVYPIAKNFYGANLTIQPAMTETVYYEIDGKKITIDRNKYHFDVDKGTITLYGDDSGLNVTYIAKCYVTLTHKFCEDKHAEPQLVTVKFVPNN